MKHSIKSRASTPPQLSQKQLKCDVMVQSFKSFKGDITVGKMTEKNGLKQRWASIHVPDIQPRT